MPASEGPASEGPVFLVRKLGGFFLLILGMLLTALGLGEGSTWLTVLGILLAVGGVVSLALIFELKVIRRDQSGPP